MIFFSLERPSSKFRKQKLRGFGSDLIVLLGTWFMFDHDYQCEDLLDIVWFIRRYMCRMKAHSEHEFVTRVLVARCTVCAPSESKKVVYIWHVRLLPFNYSEKKEIKQGLLPQFESVYPFLVCLISDTGFEGEESCKQYEGWKWESFWKHRHWIYSSCTIWWVGWYWLKAHNGGCLYLLW